MAGENAASPRLLTMAFIAVLAIVAYELYAGVALKKIGIPGVLELELGDKPVAAATVPRATAPAPTATAVSQPTPPAPPALTRDSFGGRWRMERTVGGINQETLIDYHSDGTYTGWTTQFINGYGQRAAIQGRWNAEIVSPDTFRLKVDPLGYPPQDILFKVLDQDHVQNVQENYVAERVK